MEWITLSDYMKKFGVTRKAVEQMIAEGHLLAVPVGNRKYIKLQDNLISEDLQEIKSNLQALMKHLGVPKTTEGT